MPFDFGGNLEFLPKVGQEKIIKIIGIRRVDKPGEKNNFKSWKKGDSGYHYLLKLDNGKEMPLGIWNLFFKFRDLDVKEGDTLKISHPAIGNWVVEKLDPKKVGDLDYLKKLEEKYKKNKTEGWDEPV